MLFKAITVSWLDSRGRAAADSEVTDERVQLVADQAGISVDRAKAMMKDFLDRYQGVLRFLHLLK